MLLPQFEDERADELWFDPDFGHADGVHAYYDRDVSDNYNRDADVAIDIRCLSANVIFIVTDKSNRCCT